MPNPPRTPINIRPTPSQRLWLQQQKLARGLSINALVLMAIEQAMLAEANQ